MTTAVSVVIPSYNSEKSLEMTLQSIVTQSLKNIEIIAVDDGSTDNSLDIFKVFAAKDERIHILSSDHEGAGAARNKGLTVAQGEYLSFLDADDVFDQYMLEKSYYLAKKNNQILLFSNTGSRMPFLATYGMIVDFLTERFQMKPMSLQVQKDLLGVLLLYGINCSGVNS